MMASKSSSLFLVLLLHVALSLGAVQNLTPAKNVPVATATTIGTTTTQSPNPNGRGALNLVRYLKVSQSNVASTSQTGATTKAPISKLGRVLPLDTRIKTRLLRLRTATAQTPAVKTNPQRVQANAQQAQTNPQQVKANAQQAQTNPQQVQANAQQGQTNPQQVQTNQDSKSEQAQVNLEIEKISKSAKKVKRAAVLAKVPDSKKSPASQVANSTTPTTAQNNQSTVVLPKPLTVATRFVTRLIRLRTPAPVVTPATPAATAAATAAAAAAANKNATTAVVSPKDSKAEAAKETNKVDVKNAQIEKRVRRDANSDLVAGESQQISVVADHELETAAGKHGYGKGHKSKKGWKAKKSHKGDHKKKHGKKGKKGGFGKGAKHHKKDHHKKKKWGHHKHGKKHGKKKHGGKKSFHDFSYKLKGDEKGSSKTKHGLKKKHWDSKDVKGKLSDYEKFDSYFKDHEKGGHKGKKKHGHKKHGKHHKKGHFKKHDHHKHKHGKKHKKGKKGHFGHKKSFHKKGGHKKKGKH